MANENKVAVVTGAGRGIDRSVAATDPIAVGAPCHDGQGRARDTRHSTIHHRPMLYY
jgi:hypothetical protein